MKTITVTMTERQAQQLRVALSRAEEDAFDRDQHMEGKKWGELYNWLARETSREDLVA